ncbi:ERO1-like protein beta isoform X2 [Amphiura filiformis]|uniref:ERO1-like protein beta isoform X2 n=1 Tax=Amphiura filiformis TaxID=82378 RepID=UPI003B2116D8
MLVSGGAKATVLGFLLVAVCCLCVGERLEAAGSGSKSKFESTGYRAKTNPVHRCFCELSGEVDDCNCKVESVSEFNNHQIYPRVKSLVSKDYFRFFKVNLNKACPFWPDDGQCAIRACAVCPCTDEEVPCGLKDEEAKGENKYSEEVNKDAQDEKCETRSQKEIQLSKLDTTISQEDAAAFETWREHDDAQVNFCQVDDEQSNRMAHVDLLLNPERYTGYKGLSPRRIWHAIYNENCFKPDPNTTGYQSLLTNKNVNKGSLYLQGLCLEKRVFYRLVSGLHSSINIHLCADYLLSDDPFGGETWGPNIEEFKRRFDPVTSDGEGPVRLKNLYFTYLVVLRAIAKAAPILEKEAFYTGNNESDKDVKKGIVELLGVVKSFNNHFNESLMFQGNPEEASQLKEEFRSHFWNISRIMDCVGCDKCKLWGKLQIQGLGTALKILFTSEKHTLRLSRQEVVPLLVGFSKLSNSIAQVENFQQWIAKDSVDPSTVHKKPKGSPFV